MTDLTVAKTIKDQIGGMALMMLGAHMFVGDAYSLKFKVKGSKKCQWIKIALNGLDLYDVMSYKVRKCIVKTCQESQNVYCVDLLKCLETHTNLYTHL